MYLFVFFPFVMISVFIKGFDIEIEFRFIAG